MGLRGTLRVWSSVTVPFPHVPVLLRGSQAFPQFFSEGSHQIQVRPWAVREQPVPCPPAQATPAGLPGQCTWDTWALKGVVSVLCNPRAVQLRGEREAELGAILVPFLS